MLLRVYSNRFLRNHTGKVIPRVLPSCWKLSRFRPNPTWCISRRGLKTIRGNFQTAASDSYFWKKRNDWMSYKTTTTNLNRNHMAYPTLFHAVGTQCLVAVFLIYIYIYKYLELRTYAHTYAHKHSNSWTHTHNHIYVVHSISFRTFLYRHLKLAETLENSVGHWYTSYETTDHFLGFQLQMNSYSSNWNTPY